MRPITLEQLPLFVSQHPEKQLNLSQNTGLNAQLLLSPGTYLFAIGNIVKAIIIEAGTKALLTAIVKNNYIPTPRTPRMEQQSKSKQLDAELTRR